ncbi:glycogen/starch/alpha-glucan phosphorylase [Chitinivibrio alkaliphilus]|uniref:Alpha-1,4 glucan phosphorylase n=1 Tax=Chitinivibrio alkaliphilus ACht1 TaxID=1313304 RepID=U7DAF9_9BACT|nr:glycogen/starch/alpha-glucan phosphorylase [Chitinivibrio alkaliphilus]ERP39384.1 glycogen/starch/alpha-glucan phosphorylase [Chitinivibrio alkaliphilus ACht1]
MGKKRAVKNLSPKTENWEFTSKDMDAEGIKNSFLNKIKYNLAKDSETATLVDSFNGLSFAIRDRLVERWIQTQKTYASENPKRCYYLSLEFLMGRLLGNNISNLGITYESKDAMEKLGLSLEELEDEEIDAGLGNGGLGRLAACFLDSMATLELPAIGYGIRYEYGIFMQKIINGYQQEIPEQWLINGNPWEIERPEYQYRIRFYGHAGTYKDYDGTERRTLYDTKDIMALAYDVPIPGYKNNTVNTLRLWSSKAIDEFDLADFNQGDYIGSCEDKINSENISKVLYPNDNNHSGKELRLKQQFFFTSASLQDIIRRHFKANDSLDNFAEKNAIQLNDTHPAIAVVELMRLFVDEYKLKWDHAWGIVQKTFAYTNHTLLPEALEKWSVALMHNLLPRHMEIIYEINSRFLRQVSFRFIGDDDRLRRMSIIEEGPEKMVRMAYLAIVGSHSVNGVAALHTKLLKEGLVRDFYEMWPEKFNNKTNGITPRRWLHQANRPLSDFISEKIGTEWRKDLSQLKKLEPFADDPAFQKQWMEYKFGAKKRLAAKLKKWDNIDLDPSMFFDVEIKRIHEYKRQLLKVLHTIHLYLKIKDGHTEGFVPQTIMIGGKAAPGYYMAKQIIKLINNVSRIINEDPDTDGLLRLYFVPNYRVSAAQYLIPAADLSQQISTAGKEASGTGNMKFALNGALTIGTMDGANVEMAEEIGEEHMFIFGLRNEDVQKVYEEGHNPFHYYETSPRLKRVIDLISHNYFSQDEGDIFRDIVNNLLYEDNFLVTADFDAYIDTQEKVHELYRDNPDEWARKSILNAARIGKFSSDRTISQYAEEIWDVTPLPVKDVEA